MTRTTRTSKVKVVCLECDRKFSTANLLEPRCPRCKGYDIELAPLSTRIYGRAI